MVSTIEYNRLENVLDRLIVYFKNENIKLEFYIVQEIYQGEKPTNVKYENYIFTSDSGDPQELNRIVTEVSKWGTSFDYNIQTDELFFIEINPRFQGSTRYLDRILQENNFKSIYEYNYNAFYNIEIKQIKKYFYE